jgi:hypothetical protein
VTRRDRWAGPRSWAGKGPGWRHLRHFNPAQATMFVLITSLTHFTSDTFSTRTCGALILISSFDYHYDDLYFYDDPRIRYDTRATPTHPPIMDYVDWAIENLGVAKDRLVDNSIKSFEGMTPQRWVRIIVIIGGYMLLRPFLLGFAAKRQKKQFEQEAEELGLERDAGPNANSLRGGKKAAGPGKVLGEVKEDAGEDWGDKAKTRQRKKDAGGN